MKIARSRIFHALLIIGVSSSSVHAWGTKKKQPQSKSSSLRDKLDALLTDTTRTQKASATQPLTKPYTPTYTPNKTVNADGTHVKMAADTLKIVENLALQTGFQLQQAEEMKQHIVSQARERAEIAESTLQGMLQQVMMAQQRAKTAESEAERAFEKLNKTDRDLHLAHQKIDILTDELKKAQKEAQETRDQHNQISMQLTLISQRITQAEEQRNEFKQRALLAERERDQFKQRAHDTDLSLNQIKERVAQVGQHAQHTENTLSNLRAQMSEAKNRASHAEATLRAKELELQQAQERAQRAEASLATKKHELTLAQENSHAAGHKSNAKGSLKKRYNTTRIARLEDELKKTKKQLVIAQQNLNKSQVAHNKIQESGLKKAATITNLKQQLIATNKQVQQLLTTASTSTATAIEAKDAAIVSGRKRRHEASTSTPGRSSRSKRSAIAKYEQQLAHAQQETKLAQQRAKTAEKALKLMQDALLDPKKANDMNVAIDANGSVSRKASRDQQTQHLQRSLKEERLRVHAANERAKLAEKALNIVEKRARDAERSVEQMRADVTRSQHRITELERMKVAHKPTPAPVNKKAVAKQNNKQINALQKQIERMNTQLHAAQERARLSESALASLEKRAREAESGLVVAQQKASATDQRIAKAQSIMHEKDTYINKLKQSVDAASSTAKKPLYKRFLGW